MTTPLSVDVRTRLHGHDVLVDPTLFLTEWAPRLVEDNGRQAGPAAHRLGLPPLTLDVQGELVTITPSAEGCAIGRGAGGGVTVALDVQAFSDLVQDAASAFALQFSGRGRIVEGDVNHFVGWEPVLRCLVDGRAVYEPGTIDFVGRDGRPLDLHKAFRIDDDPAEIGHFLTQAGYLHLQGVFTEEEMAAVAADHDLAMAAAQRDDGCSWWARTEAEGWYPCRILGFNLASPALRYLLHSERFARIATFTTDRWIQRDPDNTDAAEGLYKKIGVVEGASDVSWHKDCSMGGHSRGCMGLVVGISVTGAGPTNGELGVVAGSNRANVAPLGADGLDLPKVPLATSTGDLTVHCTCTLHMSRPPVSGERRVVYTGFGLAPREGDRIERRSLEEVRRDRASLNDHVRRQQRTQPLAAGFDL